MNIINDIKGFLIGIHMNDITSYQEDIKILSKNNNELSQPIIDYINIKIREKLDRIKTINEFK